MEYPFDNWVNMTYEQSVGLSKGEFSSGISDDIDKYFNENYSINDFSKFELIITSPVERAAQTAVFLKSKIQDEVEILESNDIREVTWDLSDFIPKARYEESKSFGKYDIGNKRVEAFINSNSPTTLNEVKERINKFEHYLLSREEQNIICVTHSFLMKVIYIHFVLGVNFDDFKVEDFNYDFPIKYLKGFEIKL